MRFFFNCLLFLMLIQASLFGLANSAHSNQHESVVKQRQIFEVGANDTVWAIASKIAKKEEDVNVIMRLLFEQNPEQFIDNDIDRLKKDGFLTLLMSGSTSKSGVNSLNDDLSNINASKKSESLQRPASDKGLDNNLSINEVKNSQVSIKKASLNKSSTMAFKLEHSRLDTKVSSQQLVLAQNQTASLVAELEMLTEELASSSQRINALESKLQEQDQALDPFRESLTPPINSANDDSTSTPSTVKTSLNRQNGIALIALFSLIFLVIIIRITRGAISNRRQRRSASESINPPPIDDQSESEDFTSSFNVAMLDSTDSTDSTALTSESKVPFIPTSDSIEAEHQLPDSVSGEITDFNDTDTQLQLSRLYIDMGDLDGAKAMLEKVLKNADSQQLATANDLMVELEWLS